jgi:hypothetical protein
MGAWVQGYKGKGHTVSGMPFSNLLVCSLLLFADFFKVHVGDFLVTGAAFCRGACTFSTWCTFSTGGLAGLVHLFAGG